MSVNYSILLTMNIAFYCQSDFFNKNSRNTEEYTYENIHEYVNAVLMLIVNILHYYNKKLSKEQCFQKKTEFKFTSQIPKNSLNTNKIPEKFLIFKSRKEIF